jgi:hypothetical protein
MGRLIVASSIFLLALLAAETVSDPLPPLRVRCNWWPPATGSQPVRYLLHIAEYDDPEGFESIYEVPHVGEPGQRVEQEFIFVDGVYGRRYHARIVAYDAQGRHGPWSTWNQPVDFHVSDPEP